MNPILRRTLTGVTIAAAVVAAIVFAPVKAIAVVCAALWLLAVAELFQLARRKSSEPVKATAAFLFFATALAGLFWMLPQWAGRSEHHNLLLLYVVAIVKFSDVGGFAFGLTSAKLLKDRGGNHRMCPTISPNKSWEGMAGSLICSSLVSCAFMGVTGFPVAKALVFGVSAAVLGTAGDLVESKFKRWVGVKDSSAWKITNGMGGFLDMFDSLLIAPAVLYWFV